MESNFAQQMKEEARRLESQQLVLSRTVQCSNKECQNTSQQQG